MLSETGSMVTITQVRDPVPDRVRGGGRGGGHGGGVAAGQDLRQAAGGRGGHTSAPGGKGAQRDLGPQEAGGGDQGAAGRGAAAPRAGGQPLLLRAEEGLQHRPQQVEISQNLLTSLLLGSPAAPHTTPPIHVNKFYE